MRHCYKETQQQACIEYAEAAGWHVVESVPDTLSGYDLDRPGLERVRQLLREGAVDVALAYAVDRLSRNQNHIGILLDEVQQVGARLEFVTERFEDTATRSEHRSGFSELPDKYKVPRRTALYPLLPKGHN